MWQCADFNLRTQVLFADWKLPQISKNLSFLYKCRRKCSHSILIKLKFYRTSLRPIFSWFCHEMADKGPHFLKEMFLPRFLWWKFADFKFADWNTREICDFVLTIQIRSATYPVRLYLPRINVEYSLLEAQAVAVHPDLPTTCSCTQNNTWANHNKKHNIARNAI